MATRRYGLSRGETYFSVTEAVGSATAADDVEVTFDLAKSLTKEEVCLLLDQIKYYIIRGIFPPA